MRVILKMIKEAYKRIAERLIKPSILFESKPILSDNPKAVYDELKARGFDKKYMMVWWRKSNEVATVQNNGKIKCWNPYSRKTLLEKVRNYSLFNKRKANIFCNEFIPKVSNEKAFFLDHGSPLKRVKDYYSIPKYIDYVFTQSKAFSQMVGDANGISMEHIVSLGFPRNDAFSNTPKDVHRLFQKQFKKIIIWYPTYRQHKGGLKTASSISIPIIHDVNAAVELNRMAKDNEILVVIKPHFAQDLSFIDSLELDNLVFINDEFFKQAQISSYELLNDCDALITDYSSVYYDFTLADKPIAVIWEDFEEYKKFPGFAVDLEFWMKGAEKLYTLEDLGRFFKSVSDGIDVLKSERREIRDIANFANDGKNAKRVAEFIIDKANL